MAFFNLTLGRLAFCRRWRKIAMGLLSGFSLLLLTTNAKARFVELADLHFYLKDIRSQISIQGRSRVMEVKMVFKVLNDRGREAVGVQKVGFDPFKEQVQVLEAYTLNNGKKFPVKPSQITTKDLHDNTVVGFDSQRTLMVAFPNLDNGAELVFRYRMSSKEPPYGNGWGGWVEFGNWYVDRFRLEVISSDPVSSVINDPNNTFLKEEDLFKGKHRFVVTSQKPIRNSLVTEEGGVLSASRTHRIVYSTAPNWQSFLGSTALEYSKLAADPLPALFDQIVAKAKGLKDASVEAQLKVVMADLIDRVRYFGDWKRRKGNYLPRTLAEIAQTQYADCKEVSLALVAILRKLGISAEVALVNRGEVSSFFAKGYEVASPQHFNHAIVRAVIPGGKPLWLDATNPVALLQPVAFDLVGRPVAVLGDDGVVRIENIPDSLPTDNDILLTTRIDTSLGLTKATGQIQLLGHAAYEYMVGTWGAPLDEVLLVYLRWATGFSSVRDFQVEPRLEKQRLPLNKPINYTVNSKGEILSSNAGGGYILPSLSLLTQFQNVSTSWEGDLELGRHTHLLRRVVYDKLKARPTEKFNCTITTPWFEMARKLEFSPKNVAVVDELTIKSSLVLNRDLKSNQFIEAVDKLQDCYGLKAIVGQPLSSR